MRNTGCLLSGGPVFSFAAKVLRWRLDGLGQDLNSAF
jgi:hypothetical protein